MATKSGDEGAATRPGACVGQTHDRLAQLERLLASEDSATEALADWCRRQGLAREPVISARLVGSSAPSARSDIRDHLQLEPGETLAFRHVELSCGSTVLSDARNWYVPARLTPEMNRTLEAGGTPFGAVIAPLGFRRLRLDSGRGRGGPEGRTAAELDAECPADTILLNRALIVLPSGVPLALVVECYKPTLLAPACS